MSHGLGNRTRHFQKEIDMRNAMGFAQTARTYARPASAARPLQDRLALIMDCADRIRMLGTCTDTERQAALDIVWDAYARVLAQVDPELDESWGGAVRIDGLYTSPFPTMEDDTYALLALYGEADDDGRGD